MSDHESFSDYYLSMGGDSVFRLPLAEIKRIDSIRFSIDDIQTLENYIKNFS